MLSSEAMASFCLPQMCQLHLRPENMDSNMTLLFVILTKNALFISYGRFVYMHTTVKGNNALRYGVPGHPYSAYLINPRRACAERVTVVVSCVCVCMQLEV